MRLIIAILSLSLLVLTSMSSVLQAQSTRRVAKSNEAFMADVQNKPSDIEKHQDLPQVEIAKELVPPSPPPQERGNRETPHIRDLRLSPTSEILQTYTKRCNAALHKIRQGQALSDSERRACREDLSNLYETLSRKHETKLNYNLPEPDRTLFYISAIKTAIVDMEHNGGWAFRSTLRLRVLPQLRAFIAETTDPFTAFCAIFPALDKQDTAYAVECFEILKERDTFLAQLVLEWSFLGPKDPMWLKTYYTSKGQQDKVSELGKLYFPEGMRKVHLADLSSPPTGGASFAGESSIMRSSGIRGNMVICAVDGYQADNLAQYYYIRDLNPNNPKMNLILWDGTNYQEITATIPNRRFGVGLMEYKP